MHVSLSRVSAQIAFVVALHPLVETFAVSSPARELQRCCWKNPTQKAWWKTMER